MNITKTLTFALVASAIAVNAQTKPKLKSDKIDVVTPAKTDKAEKSSIKLVETINKKSDNEIAIPYKKYVMPNGMNIVINEDHSDPIVYVDVTYHVGSAREQEGRSGFAHFFEHMMFQGSKHIADEQHIKTVSEAGGIMNGSTNTDRTNYWEVLPVNQLETALWLESDRMGFLLDSVTQTKFEVQRSTVKNERGQNYDNRPYGLVQEKIGEALYPEGHPYSWSTIGYLVDLDRVDVNDLKRFYLRWYGANNATLTISGDVTAEKILALIEKYFGDIPAGPAVNAMPKMPAVLTDTRYISYEDNIKFPMIVMTWPSVNVYNMESAAMDALGRILAGSKSTPFELGLIKTKKAVAVSAFNYDRELSGQFMIQVRANKDANLADMQKEINTIFENWEKAGGVTDAELARYKIATKSDYINRLTTVREKGAALAQYQTLTGNPDYIRKELEAIEKLTKQDIMNAYNKYVKGKPSVILSVVPKGKTELKAHDDTWKMYDRNIQQESAEYKGLTYTPVKETFDRAKKPASGESPVVKVPMYWQDKFPNGIKFIGTYSTEVPKISIQITILSGHRFETTDKAGLAYLTTNLLNESTEKHSAEEISDMLEALGSDIDISCNGTEITMNISSLTENVDKTLAIAEEILYKPKFSQDDFDRAKKQQLDAIQQQQTSASAIADQQFARILYGNSHIMGLPTTGTTETVNTLTLDDVKNYYKTHLSPSQSKVMLVGNLNQQQLMPKLQFLSKWADIKVTRGAEPAVPAISKTSIYFIDKKAAPQSEIRIGCMSMPYDATGDYYKSGIMSFSFGGAFNSRLNLLLREKRGFTYGARGGFNGGLYDGTFVMGAGVRANTTDSSVVDFMNEMKTYADKGISTDELGFTKSSIGQSDALKYEAPFQKAAFLKRLLDYNLDGKYVAQQSQILSSITQTEINTLAKKYLPYNNVNIVIVGDKQSNLDKIKKLGYNVKLLDVTGKEITE